MPSRPDRRRTTPPQRLVHRTVLFQVLIGVIAVALSAMVWAAAIVTTQVDRDLTLSQARTQAASLVLNLEEQARRPLAQIDDTLRAAKAEWERAPASFNPATLPRPTIPAVDAAAQLSVVDSQGRAIAGAPIAPEEAEQVIAALSEGQRPVATNAVRITGPFRSGPNGSWHIWLSYRIDSRNGQVPGQAVVVRYGLSSLNRAMAQTDVGPDGLSMIVRRDGVIQAVSSQPPQPPGKSIAESTLFQVAFNAPGGTWTGPSPLRALERVFAFRQISSFDLIAVVGLDQQAVLARADGRRTQALAAAGAITLLLLLLGTALAITLRTARRREQSMVRNQAVLAAANTELQVAREQADKKSLELETTFAGMSDGISMFDSRQRLVNWNHRFGELAGIPSDLLYMGSTFEQILRAQIMAGEFGSRSVEEELASRLAGLSAWTPLGVMERRRPNGSILELRRTFLPDGSFVTLYTDITARKHAEAAQHRAREAAERAAAEKSRFVAIVSHEIRTPLNVAINTFRLLDQSGLEPAQRRLVDNGLHAGEALMALLNDILDLSRMEVGRLVLRPAPFAPRSLLGAIADLFRPTMDERGILLSVHVAPDVPDIVWTDAARLRQILMNFISNAGKFADPGLAELRATRTVTEAGPVIRFAVRDAGPALPDLDRARLFRPFSQLEQGVGARGVGVGLGLAICQLLSHLLDGQIGYEAMPDGGKEFWLELPLDLLRVAPDHEPLHLTAWSARLPRSRILVVEDVAASQMIAATVLRREGHMVDLAGCGEDAVALVTRQPYDIVFMDMFMPGMDGLEATRRIRALPGQAAHVPIVALTANVSPDQRAEYMAAGMQDVLAKPIDKAAMLAAIGRYAWGKAGEPAAMLRPARLAPLAAPEDGPPVLDTARLNDLRGDLPPALFGNFVQSATEDLLERLPPLAEAVANGEGEDARKIAHAMAGVAASFGFTALEAELRRLMQDSPSSQAAAATLDSVRHKMDATERALQDFLQPQAA